MIKKIILWLWLSVISFIGFTNAKVQDVWLLKYPSEVNQNFSIWFLKGGGVLTDFLWTAKSVAGFDTSRIFWRATNWMPYVYLSSSNRAPTVQWFFDRYYSCDALTTIDTLPTNCQLWWMIDYSWDLQSTKEIFKGFFSKVVADDLVYYKYYNQQYIGATWDYWNNAIDICRSSEEIWKSLCFRGWYCYNNYDVCWWNLVNSQNLSNLSFWNVSNNWIWSAPWTVWYMGGSNIDWWDQDVVETPITWNVVISQCTNNTAYMWYRCNWYKSRMCYSSYWNNNDIFEWPWTVSWFELTWTDIADVWFYTAEYRRYWQTWSTMWYDEWFAYWRKTYEIYKQKQWTIDNPFQWVPVAIFTLMWNIDAYWLPYSNASIIDFCDVALWYVNSNSPYSWVAYSTVCSLSSINVLDCSLANDNNPDWWLPWDWWTAWTIWAVWSSWQWITNRPWYTDKPWATWSTNTWSKLSYIWDWKTFLNTYFNMLTNSYRYSDWFGIWIIPSYIVLALCALILFRFLSH